MNHLLSHSTETKQPISTTDTLSDSKDDPKIEPFLDPIKRKILNFPINPDSVTTNLIEIYNQDQSKNINTELCTQLDFQDCKKYKYPNQETTQKKH